ncbi:MAG: ATP-binding cassette domain-containing protein [Nitrospiraceae bacterium]|nr:ATP-binding cassette domain-containing protein [Nitrospiraceae bacterium]
MVEGGVALRTESLSGHWGDFRLDAVDLQIGFGEYVVLLGPSGCGKTTLMELLCGLRRAGNGRVILDGVDLTHLAPRQRRVGYVPQDYDLFPTRSVEGNVRFAAAMRREHGEGVEERFERVVTMLRLKPLLDRGIETLSGGERQRVALARALMADPALLLLDEPVSALPESYRDSVCAELKQLHREFGLTTIHVCHNLEEALLVADRLVVMDVGRVAQVGEPDEVLDRPASRFVAEFMRCKNCWVAEVQGGELQANGFFLGPVDQPAGAYWAVVRPERLHVIPTVSSMLTGIVAARTRGPHALLARVDVGPLPVWVRDDSAAPVGTRVGVALTAGQVWLIPRED